MLLSKLSFLDDAIQDSKLIQSIISYEDTYSNLFYLKPSEWKTSVNETISSIRKEWSKIIIQYDEALHFFNAIAPVRIVECKPIENGYDLKIYFFHSDQIENNDVYVISGEELHQC